MRNTDVVTDIKTVYVDPRTAGTWYPPGTCIRYVASDRTYFLTQVSDAIGDMIEGSAIGSYVPPVAPTVTTPSVQFTSSAQTVLESVGTVSLTVTLSSPATAQVSAPFHAGGSASASDYSVVTASPLVFAIGEQTKTIVVNIVDDTIIEGTETVSITLDVPTGATLGGTTTSTISIQDNEARPTVSFAVAAETVPSDGGPVTITVQLNLASTQQVQVQFGVTGTASNPTYYTNSLSPLTFAPGVTSQVITLTPVNQAGVQAPATAVFTLQSPVNATLGAITQNTATIIDSVVTLTAPLASWNFDEGTGATCADSSGNGYTATSYENAPSWCVGLGKNGTSTVRYIHNGEGMNANVDGSGNYLGVFHAATIAPLPTAFSLTGLVRITQPDVMGVLAVFGGQTFRVTASQAVDYSGAAVSAAGALPMCEWHRVTWVHSGTAITIYVDGVQVSTAANTLSLSAGTIIIGGQTATTNPFPGDLRDVRIYGYALSGAQIAQTVSADGNLPAVITVLASGTDFGGLRLREEHVPTNSPPSDSNLYLDASGVFRHQMNNNTTCWCAADIYVVPSSEYWFHGEFFIPTGLTSNSTEISKTIQTIALYANATNRRDTLLNGLFLGLDYNNGSDPPITLSYIEHYPQSGGGRVSLGNAPVSKNTWHSVDIHLVRGASGSITFFFDGNMVFTNTGIYSAAIDQAMFGLNYGIHPDNTAGHPRYIMSRNLYAARGNVPFSSGVRFTTADASVLENAGTVNLGVTLPAVSANTVTVPFTFSGTAVAGTDYTAPTSPLSIPAGTLSRNLSIPLLTPAYQAPVTLTTTLGNPSEGVIGYPYRQTTTISTVDSPPGPSIPNPDRWLPVTEGAGGVLVDSLTGAQITSNAGPYVWATGQVRGHANRAYIVGGSWASSGSSTGGYFPAGHANTWSFSALLRLTGTAVGAIFRDYGANGVFVTNNNGQMSITDSALPVPGGSMPTPGTWFRFSISVNAYAATLYINGNQVATGTISLDLSAGDVRIGFYDSAGNVFQGSYCDLRWWFSAITPETVTALNASDA